MKQSTNYPMTAMLDSYVVDVLNEVFTPKMDNDFSVPAWEIGNGRYITDNEDGTWSIMEADGESFYELLSYPQRGHDLSCDLTTIAFGFMDRESFSNAVAIYFEQVITVGRRTENMADIALNHYRK